MAQKMLIDATHAEETRVVVVDGNKVEDFDFESDNKRQLSGNIYLAKVTRVEPSLQAAFVDFGGNRHGFLAFSEVHPDYYQIPVADRQALLEEEISAAEAEAEDAPVKDGDAIPGMDVVEPAADERGEDTPADGAADAATEAAANDGTATGDEDVRELRKPRKSRPRHYKIQEVIKVRQILLVQVVKEERGNKGAALTTYLSLAGRYCVLMPNTARGGGISRKITSATDRKKLKEIATEIDVPRGAGLIIRTAGAKRTKTEIRRDYEYLQRLWEQIRELTLKSVAPTKIYEEGNLIKRSIRDLYSRDIEEVLVEGAGGYRTAKDFMKMIMPSHAKNVQHYQESLPLFARYQVETTLAGMFNPVVQLKSGGYIVIGITEALVAVDVNSGRATKQGSIEETALATNLEAAEEVARQARLRDLAGLIVIDFIDMDERKNNAAVEKRLKEAQKSDRARIQLGRISTFGLLEMSRQRLRPGMLEASTQPCRTCQGTGLIRSDDSLGLTILRQIEEEGTRGKSKEVLVRAPVGIANFLMNHKRAHVAQIETRFGLSVRIEGDPELNSPDFTLEKSKTATRVIEPAAPVVSADASLMPDEAEIEDMPDEPDVEAEAPETPEASPAPAPEAAEESPDKPKKKRRRRRRRRGGGQDDAAKGEGGDAGAAPEATAEPAAAPAEPEAAPEPEEKPARKPTRSRSRRRRSADTETPETAAEAPSDATSDDPATDGHSGGESTSGRRSTRQRGASPEMEGGVVPGESGEAPSGEAEVPAPPPSALEVATFPGAGAPEESEPAVPEAPGAAAPPTPPEPDAPAPEPQDEPAPPLEAPSKPRRRGWWSSSR